MASSSNSPKAGVQPAQPTDEARALKETKSGSVASPVSEGLVAAELSGTRRTSLVRYERLA